MLSAWMKTFPARSKPQERHHPELAAHLRYPEDSVQGAAGRCWPKYHVDDPVTFFSTSDSGTSRWTRTRPRRVSSRRTTSGEEPCQERQFGVLPADHGDEPGCDFLAAYVSASSDPDTYGRITVDHPRSGQRLKLAFNAIPPTAVSQDPVRSAATARTSHPVGQLLTLPVGQGGLPYVPRCTPSPAPRCRRVELSAPDPWRCLQRQGGLRPDRQLALDGIFGPGAGERAICHRPGPGPGTPAGAARRRQTGGRAGRDPESTPALVATLLPGG